jgi:DNA-directed RNA polymerase alpha subunit
METKRRLKTCENGHQFYKSSDCPVCPICEQNKKPEDGFLAQLAAPARRALENNGIFTLEQLSDFSEKEVLAFHGMGKSSIPKLHKSLSEKGLGFRR